MSLINDALKRAKAPSPAAKPAQADAPMRPADNHQTVGLPRYFIPVLLCIFCGALWFLLRGWDASRQAGLYPTPVTVQARTIADAASDNGNPQTPAADPSVNAGPLPTPEARNFSLNDETPTGATSASGSTPGSALAVASATTPVEPAFRLQGIFYRPSGPSAVVNAKTVYVGDPISGGRVKAIDRHSVTIERGGETQVLTLQ